uniref:SMP-30/Gluconolactonase/LRE-like region domain-containing protein n=1 Tax=Mycena chlorophos TaxID=658473 RepID=A0ABQ0LM58_MYCCL|nr:predicted protein [Mycena chlorophos]
MVRLFARILTALAFTASALATLPTTTVYQSPAGLPFENIAVRASGALLLTSVYSPILYSLDATTGVLTDVVTVGNGATALLGITEYEKDTFAVVACQFDTATSEEIGGTAQIWSINLTGPKPVASEVSALPSTVVGANGISAIYGSSTVFVADSGSGTIFAVNMNGGTNSIALTAPALAPIGSLLGINGLKVHGSSLFFTNSAAGTFGFIPIPTSRTGAISTILSPTSIVTLGKLEDGAASSTHVYDDFAIDASGRAWVATHPGSITLFTPRGNTYTETDAIVGDRSDSNVFKVPTSAAFGRTTKDSSTLYVTTDGGQVIAVNTSGA